MQERFLMNEHSLLRTLLCATTLGFPAAALAQQSQWIVIGDGRLAALRGGARRGHGDRRGRRGLRGGEHHRRPDGRRAGVPVRVPAAGHRPYGLPPVRRLHRASEPGGRTRRGEQPVLSRRPTCNGEGCSRKGSTSRPTSGRRSTSSSLPGSWRPSAGCRRSEPATSRAPRDSRRPRS